MTQTFESLPDAFKNLIERMRANDPLFSLSEEIEVFCCTEAVKIASACKTLEKAQDFGNLLEKEQREIVEDLSDEHTNHSIERAVQLACWYLNRENEGVK